MNRSLGRRTRVCVSALLAVAVASPLLRTAPQVAHASGTPMISVYTAEVFGGIPTPWSGSPATNYVGTASPSDSAALRLSSSTAQSISDVSLTIGTTSFDLWGNNLSIPANGNLVLTETVANNFELDDGNTTCQNATLNITVVGYGVASVALSGAGTAQLCSDTPQWQYAGQTGASGVSGGPAGSPTTGPSGGETFGGSNPGESQQYWCSVGDPVNCATGNYSETATDLAIPGRGRALLLSRTYNAQAAATEAAPDALGWGWTDSYAMSATVDASGNVTVHQENGSTVTFSPSGAAYTAPLWVTASLVKNADGSYTYALANGRSDTFGSSGALLSETDRNGYVTSLAYSGGKLATVTDPAGRAFTFTYNASGQLAQVSDAGGRSVSFAYDGAGNLTSVTGPDGGVTTFAYDSLHRLTTMADADGGVTTNVYDSGNRVTSQTDPMHRTTTMQYASGQTTITHPAGDVTSESFSGGELVSLTRGVGTAQAATWQYGYDGADNRTLATDPNGLSWHASYDTHGNLLATSDPQGRSATYSYDSANDMTSSTDALGFTTTYLYNAHGDLTSSSQPLTSTGQTATWSYTYGDATHPGDVTAMTDPLVDTTHYAYDANGDRTSTTDPLNGLTTKVYDVLGRMTSSVSARGNAAGSTPSAFTSAFTYDKRGDMLSFTDPVGDATTWQYDALGRQVATTDPDKRTTATTFDADGEVTAVKRGDGSVLQSGYDANGNRTSQTDALNHATTYGYDVLNRMVTVTDPLGRRTLFTYDAGGRRTSMLDALNRTTTYGYDASNELTGITYTDGKTPNVSYQYDADGRRMGMIDGLGHTSYGYDSMGRLTSQVNGFGQTTEYEYDLDGHLTTLLYPTPVVTADGATVGVSSSSGDGHPEVSRSYDALGHMTSVTDWLQHTSSFRYDADGNQVGTTYANGIVEAIAYDNADRVTSMNDTGPAGQFLVLPYTHDATGDITSANPVGPASAVSSSYTYDGADRLATSGVPSPVNGALPNAYQYDAADHVTQTTASGVGTTQTYDAADELLSSTTSAATTTYTYDLDGHRTSTVAPGGLPAATYGYDQAGRLISYAGLAQNVVNGQTGQNITLTYAYDGDGLRASKQGLGYEYDIAEGLPLVIADGTTAYITGPSGLPVEQVTAAENTVLYYQHDAQGSTRAMTDQAGRPVLTYTYNDWGKGTPSTTAVANPFQFAGQYTDVETGLQYLRARYYDPSNAQFLTRDPLFDISRAPYSYAGDNPLDYTDPSGKLFGLDSLLGAAIGGIVGTVAGAGSYLIGAATGQHDFSWRDFGGAAAGGLVGGAAGGACIGTTWVALAACGAVGGVAGNVTTDLIDGQPITPGGLLTSAGLGAAGGVVGGALFPLRGFTPYRMYNIWNPGINAMRLYGQDAVGAGIGMFQGILSPTPAC